MKKLIQNTFLYFILFLSCNNSSITLKSSPQSAVPVTVYLKDSGARPNDGQDDTRAIQTSMDKMKAGGGTLIFEPGTYNISDQILTNFTGSGIKIKIEGNGALLKTAGFQVYVFYLKCKDNMADIEIDDLKFDGSVNNLTRTKMQNGVSYGMLIRLWRFRKVKITDCQLSNIYGTGIRLDMVRLQDVSQKASQQYFQISNCKISNCSGLKTTKDPTKKTFDNYGDGINVYGGKNGLIDNCEINNNLDQVGKVGRAGIAIFGSNINIQISKNVIKGYDRAIHIENSYGGHQILNNTISDNNVGFIMNAYGCPYLSTNPINITGNTINGTTRDRKVIGGIVKPWAQILITGNNTLLNGSKIEGNYIKDGYNAEAHYFFVSHQAYMYVNNNTFIGSKNLNSLFYIEKELKSLDNNSFTDFKKIYIRGGSASTKGNKQKNCPDSNLKNQG